MKNCAKYLLTLPLALLLLAAAAYAEETEPPDVPAFSQAELDQMLAPIALYPDALLSQILMASTYPLEVVEAARWSRANPGLSGEQAVQAVEDRRWDPSVKALVAFPRILALMDEKLEWMQQLGDAFLAQQTQVMDTVQGLRQKAYAAGNLKSGEHYRVQRQGEDIVVESPYREVIYVPYYDPLVVYGPWWWPAYPPVYWAPWPGYRAHAGFVGFRWSVGIVIGPRFFFGACDWPRRHITVVHVRHTDRWHKAAPREVWHHDPYHRHGVKYRHASVQKKFVHHRTATETRREGRHPTRNASDAPVSRWGKTIPSGDTPRRHNGNPNKGGSRNDDRTAHPAPGRPDPTPGRSADRPKQEYRAIEPKHEYRATERRHDPRERHLEARSTPNIGAPSRVNTPAVRLAPTARVVPEARPELRRESGARFSKSEQRSRGERVPSRREHAGVQARGSASKGIAEARSPAGTKMRSSGGFQKFGEFGFR